jgi:hypothetical protein
MRLGRRAVGWIAVGLFSILPASSSVVAAADAAALIQEGVALRRRGDDAAALRLFEQALQIEPSPKALAQVGLAEQALGRWAMASEHLHRALEDASDPWIKKNRATISEALNRVDDRVGQLEILGGSPNAEVRINGLTHGKLPLAHPIPVSTGTVTIGLAAPGFVSVQRTIDVRAHQTVRESFDALVPLSSQNTPSAPMAAAGTSATEPAAARRDAAEQQLAPMRPAKITEDEGSPTPGSFRTKAKWVVWGAGVAALGVGVFGELRQNQAGDSFVTGGCGIDAGHNVVASPGGKAVDDCRALKTQVDSNYKLEIAGLVGAGVLAATGLVLWLTEPASRASQDAEKTDAEKTALACSPGMTLGGGPWVGCRITF